MVKFNINTGDVSGTPREVKDFIEQITLTENNEEYKQERVKTLFKRNELENKKLDLEMYRVIEGLGKYITSEELDEESEADNDTSTKKSKRKVR